MRCQSCAISRGSNGCIQRKLEKKSPNRPNLSAYFAKYYTVRQRNGDVNISKCVINSFSRSVIFTL